MPSAKDYRQELQASTDWRATLLKNSGLPGPRGNLELAQAFAEVATKTQIEELLSIPAEQSPENSAQVFLVFCGIAALGKSAGRGGRAPFKRLRSFASDGRWRVREAVAIALQYVGDTNMPALIQEMQPWSEGNWYEKRAAAAALAEPRLLKDTASAAEVLHIFDKITRDIHDASDPQEESFKVLRQSMGYCWSVAVAAAPQEGKRLMAKWLASSNADVRWIMKENLKKNRLIKTDPAWVKDRLRELERPGSKHGK